MTIANSVLDKITVIVFTYNRNFFFSRICNYLHSVGFPRIIIADSSSTFNQKLHQSYIGSLNSPHISLEKFAEDIHPLKKIVDALKKSDTEFVVCCSDKDFPIPEGIVQGISFLEQNPGISVIDGLYHSIKLSHARNFSFSSIYHCYDFRYRDENPKIRLNAYLSQYSIPIFYAIHRRDMLIFSLTTYLNDFEGYCEPRFGEIFPACIDIIHGKYERLPVPYWYRSGYGPSGASVSPTMTDYARSGTLQNYYSLFEKGISEAFLDQYPEYDNNEIVNLIKSSFAHYIINKGFPINPVTLDINRKKYLQNQFLKIGHHALQKMTPKRESPILTNIVPYTKMD
ncbi:MAG: TIGR00180 family glycosyltransferase, partial [Methanomicrobiales archaeon]|nr:TIGR00180 family glycosyltransferase [Methanomicrobiales archaeon]